MTAQLRLTVAIATAAALLLLLYRTIQDPTVWPLWLAWAGVSGWGAGR